MRVVSVVGMLGLGLGLGLGAGSTPEDVRLPVSVVNSDCQPFPGVTVVLVPTGDSVVRAVATAVTDANGVAVFVKLSGGRYDAIASLPDFVESRVGPFVLPSKGDFRVTLALNPSHERTVRLNEGTR